MAVWNAAMPTKFITTLACDYFSAERAIERLHKRTYQVVNCRSLVRRYHHGCRHPG